MSAQSMTRPALPPCPTCGEAVDNLEGVGAEVWAWPCGHPVSPIIGAGGVTGAIILQPREAAS
jgi:hypothetical protein